MAAGTRLRWLGLAVAGLALAAGPATAQTFGGATEVVEVEVPVQVVRDGQPVRGLTAADFEVYDGRKKQAVIGFHVVDLAVAAPRAAVLPMAGRRQFLLLFDLAFSDPKAVVKAREAARGLVLRGLRPGDLVGVATYSAARGPQLVLGFTTDRRQVDAALETLGLVRSEQGGDPLRLVLEPGGDRRQLTERRQEAEAAHTDALLAELGPQLANMGREASRAAQRDAVTSLTRSYAGLARMLGALPGRKQVVYFSEGFDSSLLTGSAGTAAGGLAAGGEADPTGATSGVPGSTEGGGGRDATSTDPVLSASDETFGSSEAVNDLERMFEEFRRADCVIQAVDIGGLRAGGEQQVTRTGGRESLVSMARGTGGEIFQNTNDLAASLASLLDRTSVTYVLSFQPEKVKADGSYHKLKVTLKNAPRGTQVSSRTGWYAPKPYAQLNPMEKLFAASSRLMGGEESGAIPSAVLAAPFRTAGERAYVPVLIEVDGPALLAGKAEGTLPVEVYVYALGEDGSIQDFLFQSLGLDLAKAAAALQQSGLKFFGHLDLPAGEHSVRTLVRNGATGAFSLRVVPLTVPAFAAGPVLLPPLFPEPPNRWLIVRETQRGPQVPYPFMARQQPYVPASRPALPDGGETAMALVGYNLGTGDLTAAATVLSRDGQEVGKGEVRLLGREGGGAGSERLAAAFRPPKLPPGEYVLQVTLTGAAGPAGTSRASFVVGAGR